VSACLRRELPGRRISAEWPDRIELLRPVDYFCDAECPVVADGIWLYFDRTHFTAAGSDYMVKRAEVPLTRFIETALARQCALTELKEARLTGGSASVGLNVLFVFPREQGTSRIFPWWDDCWEPPQLLLSESSASLDECPKAQLLQLGFPEIGTLDELCQLIEARRPAERTELVAICNHQRQILMRRGPSRTLKSTPVTALMTSMASASAAVVRVNWKRRSLPAKKEKIVIKVANIGNE
jgi:hypothetical protein